MIMQKFVYDEKFGGKILVLESNDCGKTSFTERIPVNNIFGKLAKAEWLL